MSRMRLVVIVLPLFAAGWVAGSVITVRAGYTPLATFGAYSYSSGCVTRIDPVSLIFTFGDGSTDHVYEHASRNDHGLWNRRNGNAQYFLRDGTCSYYDDNAASQDGWGHNQYHMRWEMAWTDLSSWSYAATPHYESWSWTEWTHCVPSNGFILGREDVVYQWKTDGNEHPSIISNWWGNTIGIAKCGSTVAANDGYVKYVDMDGNDAY